MSDKDRAGRERTRLSAGVATDYSAALLAPLQELVSRYPEARFLTLGQTVFWDEPMKAVVRGALAWVAPDFPFVLAVHDTDYFARPHATLASVDPFVILAHNDGSTQNLWCAAGELSRLFGAETVPTRQALRAAGVRLDIAARVSSQSLHDLVDRVTEAWGWRGIAHTSGVETLTHEVSVQSVLPCLEELLEWGFNHSAETMCRCTGSERGRALGARIMAMVQTVARESISLSELFQRLFPYMHELVSGESAVGARISHSLAESQFNCATAQNPRFRIVDLFLRPDSRDTCIQAYNDAVAGSEIYTLDRFGPDSIPFDLVTPDVGRGTIRVSDEGVYIEGRRSHFLPTPQRVESITALAALIEKRFGAGVSLVGKAITWIAIMAVDHIFIFNETASGYTPRTRAMLQQMRRNGVSLDVHPILRVRYHTWDALAGVESGFCLPDHYAEAFGVREIATREFSQRWRSVMKVQEEMLLELGQITRPVDLLRFLEARAGAPWTDLLQRYLDARAVLRAANAGFPDQQRREQERRQERYNLGLEIDALQKRMGVLRRSHSVPETEMVSKPQMTPGTGVAPETEMAPGAEYEYLQRRITALHARRARLLADRAALKADLEAKRRAREYQQALEVLRRAEGLAEGERLRLARNAYLVAHSLEHNNLRPTAWWLPLVSPDGAWFRAICETTEAFIEEL